MGDQVGPHRRPNFFREHLFVIHLLTEACFAGPREEVGFAAAGDGLARPSPKTTVTAANAAPHHGGSHKAAEATNQKPLVERHFDLTFLADF
jgi:hypothetical protein